MMASLPTNPMLQASLIIPTHNRREQLRQGLQALTQQDVLPGVFEVILVLDACTDGTLELVDEFAGQLEIYALEQPGLGPGAARNRGARAARAARLIFMDDDVTPAPGFVRAHLEAPGQVLIGYLPPHLGAQQGYFRQELFDWWEANFARLRLQGCRFQYSDLTSGNFSLPADLFWQAGGFNEEFRCHEDYELGVRLLAAGAEFEFSDRARGAHYENSDLARSLQRKFDEGEADVRLGRLYPELRKTFLMWRLERYALLPTRLLKLLAFQAPFLARPVTAGLRLLAGLADRLGMFRLWQRIVYGLLGYWYWRGAAKELGSLRALKAYLPQVGQAQEPGSGWTWVELDLAHGLEQGERLLDAQRPDGVRLVYQGIPAGEIPPLPGGERLAGRHLRPALVRNLAAPVVKAMVSTPDAEYPEIRNRLKALCDQELARSHAEAVYE
jgi:glycosyltransferase involved in cell wall biosynthesis